MQTIGKIVKMVVICCLYTVGFSGEDRTQPNIGKDAGVTIEITKFDVNDLTLTLNYSVKNGTSREAWVCSKSGRMPFEVFLTSDKQTLLIRKRLDVPSKNKWRLEPVGTYVRVASGASLTESVQMTLPVSAAVEYANEYTKEAVRPVRRVALEVGYYDEDLPALIHSIFALADKSCLTIEDVPSTVLNTYFRGLFVRTALVDFDRVNPDPYGRGCVYVRYSWQAFTGEKTLRVDVNDVSIPYGGDTDR